MHSIRIHGRTAASAYATPAAKSRPAIMTGHLADRLPSFWVDVGTAAQWMVDVCLTGFRWPARHFTKVMSAQEGTPGVQQPLYQSTNRTSGVLSPLRLAEKPCILE